MTAKISSLALLPRISSSNILPIKNRAPWSKLNFSWLRFERFRNGIIPRPNNPLATYTELQPRYRPGSPEPSFNLPAYRLSTSDCVVYKGAGLSQTIAAKYLTPSGPILPVHPQTSEALDVPYVREISQEKANEIEVSPTASSRTVYVLGSEDTPHCLKLHFPFQITRSKRTLDHRTIQHSINVSDTLVRSGVALKSSQLGFLLETLGISYKSEEDSWGTLVREMTPYPRVKRGQTLLPLFSLYAPDATHPEDPAVLKQLIEASGQDPADFILEKVLFPLLENWVKVFLETGVVLEAHGQNTCFEYDEETGLGRIVFRDFDTYVHRETLEKNGLSSTGMMTFTNEKTETKPKGSVFSLLFDQAMRVPFDSIASFAEKEYGIPQELLQKQCRLFFRCIFPQGDLYFPDGGKVYNYKDRSVLEPGVKTQLVESDRANPWR